MRQTSSKAILISVGLIIVGFASMFAADAYYRSIPNKINFGADMGRPWNFFDFLWIPAFVLAAAFFIVAIMFASKDD